MRKQVTESGTRLTERPQRHWLISQDACPICDRSIEHRLQEMTLEDDSVAREYVTAERCTKCRWIQEFDLVEHSDPPMRRY